MWFICALLTFTFWGLADLFYKKGNDTDEKNSHYKTGIMVGLVMGIHATAYILITRPEINFIELVKYFPVSFCYMASMIIGYKGLKYLDLSISSPLQNSSGVITSLLLVLIYKVTLSDLEWFGILLIGFGVFFLSLLENKEIKFRKKHLIYFLFPLFYAILDGAGTFLDGIFLDHSGIVSEDAALISYEYTFFLYAAFLFVLYKFRDKQKFSIRREGNRLTAAIFETAGQFFYVFAMASHSELTAPIVASYSILSVILSRIFLKEKLTRRQYLAIFLILFGIFMLGVAEGLE